jgi:hypothetical protein
MTHNNHLVFGYGYGATSVIDDVRAAIATDKNAIARLHAYDDLDEFEPIAFVNKYGALNIFQKRCVSTVCDKQKGNTEEDVLSKHSILKREYSIS